MPSWSRGFINDIHAFREGHEIDKITEDISLYESRAAENSGETQSSSIQEQLSYWGRHFGRSYPEDEGAA